MSVDPLSDIVRSLNLTGAVFLNAEFTAPWAITAHVTEDDCRPFMPIPRQVIAYHVVVDGEAVFSLNNGASDQTHYRVTQGDIIFVPRNKTHILASSKGVQPVPGDDLLLPCGEDGLVQIRHGGGGDLTRILCGFMASETGSSPLLETLPEILIVSIESLETRRWIEASVLMAAQAFSKGRLSSGAMVPTLCQLLLTEALRAHIEQSPKPSGWLGGIAHPRIGPALSQIHASLTSPPGIDTLAAEAGMSRSAFVERFSQVMGVAPSRYMLNQRMELAKALLQDDRMTTAEIAFKVGYDAPEAFSRAFKRETGHAPGSWRDLKSAAS
ncbi:MAG: AraC family transcriptional regulator [Pseudomonadota bacterium]